MMSRLLPLALAAAACLTGCAPRKTAPGIDPQPRTGFFQRRSQERLQAVDADVAVIFIGGFGEWVLTHIREVYETMPVLPAKGRQVRAFYAWDGGSGPLRGYTTKGIRRDIETFLDVNPQASLVFIGHSYGGSAVMDVIRHLKPKHKGKCIAVTLDPVSQLPRSKPRKRAEGVDHWINVYCSPYRSPRDGLASIGGPWRECTEADVNIVFSGRNRDKDGHRYQHAEVKPLFYEKAEGQEHTAHELLEEACRRILPQE